MKNRIRAAREKRKLSQDELAKIVGVDRTSVSKWECGAAFPRMKTAIALAKALDCSVDRLIGA